GHSAEAIPFLNSASSAQPWNMSFKVRLAQAQIAASANVDATRDALAAIASDKRAEYEDRCAAATSLAGTRANVDMGSKELELLARSGPIRFEETDKPFYYVSRLAAARRTTDATEQFRLLSAAVKARPFADDVRVPLLRAALNSAHFQTAVDAIEPLAYNGNFLS